MSQFAPIVSELNLCHHHNWLERKSTFNQKKNYATHRENVYEAIYPYNLHLLTKAKTVLGLSCHIVYRVEILKAKKTFLLSHIPSSEGLTRLRKLMTLFHLVTYGLDRCKNGLRGRLLKTHLGIKICNQHFLLRGGGLLFSRDGVLIKGWIRAKVEIMNAQIVQIWTSCRRRETLQKHLNHSETVYLPR